MSRGATPKPRPKPRRAAAASPPVRLPLAPRMVWKLLIGGFAALVAAVAVVGAMYARLPERAALDTVTAASRAGFVVRHVDISGAANQPRLDIYRELLSGGSDSMLLLDLAGIRRRLVALPWVLDASVARRWPDRLEVRIVERRPAAIWQHRGRMLLVDREGRALPSDHLERFADLPLVVGPHANRQAAPFMRLLAAEPDLAGKVRAAVWVGDRRWDLKLASGETLSLPEGPAAAVALKRFAAVDRATPLLGRGFQRFDLRIPDRMVIRVSGEAGAKAQRREVPAPPAPQQQALATVRMASAPGTATEVVI